MTTFSLSTGCQPTLSRTHNTHFSPGRLTRRPQHPIAACPCLICLEGRAGARARAPGSNMSAARGAAAPVVAAVPAPSTAPPPCTACSSLLATSAASARVSARGGSNAAACPAGAALRTLPRRAAGRPGPREGSSLPRPRSGPLARLGICVRSISRCIAVPALDDTFPYCRMRKLDALQHVDLKFL